MQVIRIWGEGERHHLLILKYGMMVKGSNLMPDASWQRNPGYAAREDGIPGVLPEGGWVEYEDGCGMLVHD